MPRSDDVVVLEGTVIKALPNTQFKVKLSSTGVEILAYLSGKMRMHYIRILLGDHVQLEMSKQDMARGRITYRYKKE